MDITLLRFNCLKNSYNVVKQVREGELDMNLPNLKLWVAGALLNQGFDFKTSPIGVGK